MVETANEWLSQNPEYDVVNCESTKIMFKFNDSQNYYDLRPNDISHYIYGTEKNNLLKALRVWIRRRELFTDEPTTSNEPANNNLDAGYVTDSLSPDTPQQESPKLSNLSSILKRRWTQPQQQLQKTPNKHAVADLGKAESSQKAGLANAEIHSTDHSPVKKNAFQQQQAFRLQQYSSQSKFFLNKLQRQASCPPSRETFQISHTAAQQPSSAQNSPVYNAKQSHNQHSHNQHSTNQTNQQAVAQPQASQPTTTGQLISGSRRSVVLAYVDIVPECNEENGKFERLEDCLKKLNRLIKSGEIKGRVLNVETGSCEATVKWKIDTEITFTALTSKNVNFLRCFYAENEQPEANERIKVQDFVPDHLSAAGFFKRPRFESFSHLVPKLTEWLVNNPDNLDEEIKEKQQSRGNAKIQDSGTDCDSLVKKLRDFSTEDKRQIYLSSKLFLCHRKGQTINDLKQEIQEWSRNYQLETRSKSANSADAAKPRILACETIQLFCKQNFFEMNKNNDFTYLQKATEETFTANRFGLKNGYLVNAFRVFFDVGWFAWNRLGYAQKLSNAQKLKRKRFNYSTSVDEEHLKQATGKGQSSELDWSTGKSSREFGRRRSCMESSLEDDYEIKLLTDDQIVVKSVKELDRKPDNKLEKLESSNRIAASNREPSRPASHCKEDKDSLMLESEFSEFSSLSMLANVSKLELSNSSLSTSIASSEESKCLNQPDEKLGTNFKRKIKRINFRQQSIDNQDNCSLV
ncbi:hypothetical protein L1887_61372 [Cichorium endivia]|nr:hypothetical protein L1887_61372 [Cichorium endivia]